MDLEWQIYHIGLTYKIGKKLMRYLQRKKFRTYIKAVYVDYALPNWHGYIDERVDKMLQGIDKNCTENIQTFTHCPAYKTLGTLHSQQKNYLQINIICPNCLVDFIYII